MCRIGPLPLPTAVKLAYAAVGHLPELAQVTGHGGVWTAEDKTRFCHKENSDKHLKPIQQVEVPWQGLLVYRLHGR